MGVYNPNTPLRKAIVDGLRENVTGEVWAGLLPKDKNVLNQYILISSQSKNQTERSKCDFEWLCTVNFDIISINLQGFNSPVNNDELEEKVINFIESDFYVNGFYVKEKQLINSIDLNVDTDVNSIERRVLTYQFWVWISTT